MTVRNISPFTLHPSPFLSSVIGAVQLTLLLGLADTLHAAAHPNVIVILSDDQGWGDLSINGNTNLQTPSIDALGREGAVFDRFYVCAVCSPTRAEFLTGRYHVRSGVTDTSAGGERMALREHTIAETFKAAGYATGVFGKWHNGSQYPYHPTARGFDTYYGIPTGHWSQYFNWFVELNGAYVRFDGFIADNFTDQAIQFIQANQSRPFFCYLPYNTPHSPMQVPDRFYEKFREHPLPMRNREPERENVQHTRAALAMCENIDWNVGRICGLLDELDLAERTIVVYFSDNGPNGVRWNGDMKGRKGSTDEGGVRSPCMVRWPGRIPPGAVIPHIAAAIDLLPTLSELAGIPLNAPNPLDGISVAPLLLQTVQAWPDRMYFSHWNGRVSVRTDQYRLDNDGHLFDMPADPGQRRDIAAEQPGVAARLSRAMADWRQTMLPAGTPETPPSPVGYREFPLTWLPARDGIPHGAIQRSNRFPNCSYFTNWTDPEDAITWDIQVENSGAYEAVVYYTCPSGDEGSTIALEFNGNHVSGRITEPHDPPLIGAQDDRDPRMESYDKEFKPLTLGTVLLDRGRGLLTLRATNIPGKQVMDARGVKLTLLP